MSAIADRFLDLLETGAARRYGDELVSQRAHALQCALLAEEAGAPAALIAAALLHDIGHLLHKEGEAPALRGIDAKHEAIGGKYLARDFGPAVAEPVRLHVPAKRWLCATDPDYFARLSPGSVRSLALQGGPFTPEKAAAFRALPFAEEAIRVRIWDDAAKRPELPTPPAAHYRAALEAALAG